MTEDQWIESETDFKNESHDDPVIAKPQGAYRVLHSADWHLGKMLGDYSRYEEHRRFLNWMLETIHGHQIDALIIAGDIFDSARPPQSALQQYYEFLARLYRENGGNCRVVVTSGNHDSPANLDAPREVLKALNATVVGQLPEEIAETIVPLPDAENPELLVAALPFLRDGDLRNGRLGQTTEEIQADLRSGIAARYEQVAAACENPKWASAARLAVGHLTVQGAKNSDSEREIHIGGLGAIGTETFPESFSYVALGHLHRPQSIGSGERVCYSGSPIPLSYSEASDKKSVRIVDFSDGKLVGNQKLAIPVNRHLKQMRTNRQEMEKTIRETEIPAAELPTWIELVVETADASENITDVSRELADEMPFVITQVVVQMIGDTARLTEADLPVESIDVLLENPVDVFDRLLEQQVDLSEDDIAAIRTAFAELRDIQLSTEEEDESQSTVAVGEVAGEQRGEA